MKRVLVTGGSRGLGLAICHRLLAEGWQVTATARRSTPGIENLATLSDGRLRFIPADLGSADGVPALARSAGTLDGFDGLVANAAVGSDGLLTMLSEAGIRECVELNLISVMLLTREVLKGMMARRAGGSLVLVSSVAARTGMAGLSVYAATKGGLLAFSRTIAREYGSRGIRSNCVLPGFLDTEMTVTLASEQRERLQRRTPLRRRGQPEDVAGAVAYLLGDEAAHVTGTELVIDGGMTA